MHQLDNQVKLDTDTITDQFLYRVPARVRLACKENQRGLLELGVYICIAGSWKL